MNPQESQQNNQPMQQGQQYQTMGQGTQSPQQSTQQPNPFQSMINTVKQNPNSDYAQAVFDKIRSGEFNDLAKKYGYDLTPFNVKPVATTPTTPTPEQGLFQRIGSDFATRGKEVVGDVSRMAQTAETAPTGSFAPARVGAETGLRIAGQVAGGAMDILGEAAKSAWNTFVPDSIKNMDMI